MIVPTIVPNRILMVQLATMIATVFLTRNVHWSRIKQVMSQLAIGLHGDMKHRLNSATQKLKPTMTMQQPRLPLLPPPLPTPLRPLLLLTTCTAPGSLSARRLGEDTLFHSSHGQDRSPLSLCLSLFFSLWPLAAANTRGHALLIMQTFGPAMCALIVVCACPRNLWRTMLDVLFSLRLLEGFCALRCHMRCTRHKPDKCSRLNARSASWFNTASTTWAQNHGCLLSANFALLGISFEGRLRTQCPYNSAPLILFRLSLLAAKHMKADWHVLQRGERAEVETEPRIQNYL